MAASILNGDSSNRRLAVFCGLSVIMTLAVMVTSWTGDTRLGAPAYWPWVLTGFQVLALWSAGRRAWWGWLLGAAAQPAWIGYALVTHQLGFIPGCIISAVVQVSSFLRMEAELDQPAVAA